MRMLRFALAVAITVAVLNGVVSAQGRRGGPEQQRGPAVTFRTDVPVHSGDVVLGCPEATSVTFSFLTCTAADGVLVWGTDARALPDAGRALSLKAAAPMIVTIDGLKPDTHYYYELRDAASRTRLLPQAGPGSFHTARPQGSRFTFTVTADSHLDDHTSPEVYLRTLADAKADKPDFHIELGDTFMTEKHASHESAYKQYLAQRFYLGDNGLGVPLYFVLGNHDGEGARGRGNADSGLGVWANLTRKRLFPNPVPDGFYTGDGLNYPEAGLLQDYYAWEWGDALFVVLDPYWFPRKAAGPRDNWTCSLGDAQYQWLTATLERSHAKLRFVFIHNLVGGSSSQGRGGAEAVPFYEWGGRNQDGTPGFALSRPGWSLPIHDLLVRNHVNVVFHGHDHLYAKQDVDGIVYLEVPQPGDPRGSTRSAAEYGYVNGTILGSSGHVRVAVSPTGANVDYISSGGKVAHSFSVPSGAGK